MSLPNDFPSGGGMVPGIIVSRGDKRNDPGGAPDSTQTGMCQVALIGRHNFPSQVPLSHLPLSTFTKPPMGGDQDTISPALDKGTTIMAHHQTGRSDVVVSGSFSDLNESSGGTPGNINLMQMFQFIMSQGGGQRASPDFKEVTKGGAKIREIIEKGFEHSHSKLAGLPTHGAILSLLKTIPAVNEIPTAIQKFSSIINSAMGSSLPGKSASVGTVFNSINSDPVKKKQIENALAPNMLEAFNSVSLLAQSGDHLEIGGDVTGLRVHEETFANNAVALLSQVKTIDDLVSATHQLLYDTSLHGHDQLANTTFNIETPYGNNTYTLTAHGEIVENEDANTANARIAFSDSMSSAAGSPSGTSGGSQNMFGSSMKTMLDMFERLSPQAQKAAKKLVEEANKRSQKIGKPGQKTFKGQTPHA